MFVKLGYWQSWSGIVCFFYSLLLPQRQILYLARSAGRGVNSAVQRTLKTILCWVGIAHCHWPQRRCQSGGPGYLQASIFHRILNGTDNAPLDLWSVFCVCESRKRPTVFTLTLTLAVLCHRHSVFAGIGNTSALQT